ncbi:hypothetical protein [Runella sp.]|jgi:hypothetical protein|uniref:hypothetical protein n=1 Tax=Runella sp. TaxID=1960881 RepID=UPI00301620AF
MHQSISKTLSELPEDRFRIDENVIALADGAGGMGVYAGEWASYLCEHLPSEPWNDFSAFEKWLDNIWEQFFDLYQAQSQNTNWAAKFIDEGSASTLIAVWPQYHKAAVYGDSVLFVYDSKHDKLSASLASPLEFNESPYLINWREPALEVGFRLIDLPKQAEIWLASDTLAQYLWGTFLQSSSNSDDQRQFREVCQLPSRLGGLWENIARLPLQSFEKDVLQPLKSALTSENGFREYVEKLQSQKMLGIDDMTLIIHSLA